MAMKMTPPSLNDLSHLIGHAPGSPHGRAQERIGFHTVIFRGSMSSESKAGLTFTNFLV
jgi:hypothetical protein